MIIILDGNAKQGGASRRVGGSRDERPPQSSSPSSSAGAITAANNPSSRRWIPVSVLQSSSFSNQSERNDGIFRKVRGILNKLTPEKFDKLSLELLNVGIESQTVLKGIILLIFEKALDEPKYSSLYAQLCHRLCEDAPNFEPPSSDTTTFRKLLLSKCQDEFQNRSRATEAFERDGPLTADEREQCLIAKHKMLGNIKFIGELGKLDMLHEGILHKCIKQLLEKKKMAIKDMSEDMECLCQIMRTVGKRLDHEKAKLWMDAYFERMKAFQANQELPSRVRFMLQDVIELRRNRWQPRRNMNEGAPKTIQQVREEVAKESGVFIPRQQLMSPPYMIADPFFGPAPRGALNGHLQRPSGMADIFAPLPPPYMGSGSLGTGPGVIHIDHFAKGYQANRARNQINSGGGMRPFKEKTSNFSQYHEDGKSYRSDLNDDDESTVMNRQNKSYHGGDGGTGGGRDGMRDGGGGERMQNSHAGNHDKPLKTSSAQQGGREVPPRFQKKNQQQQQQKDSGLSDSASPGSHSPPPAPSGQQQQQQGPMAPNRPHLVRPPPNMNPYMPPMGSYPAAMGIMTGSGPVAPMSMMGGGGGRGSGSGLKASQNADEISLRPMRGSFVPMLRPNVPSMLPRSAQSAHTMPLSMMQQPPLGSMLPPNALNGRFTNVHITPIDKNKSNKTSTNKDETTQPMETVAKSYLETANIDDVLSAVSRMKSTKKLVPELLTHLMSEAVDKSDNDRDNVSTLIAALKERNFIQPEYFMEAFTALLNRIPALEQNIPLAKSYLAKFAANAVASDIIGLADLATPLNGGIQYPLFLLCLQQLVKIKDRDWLAKNFTESKINLQNMLPELNKDRMMEILEDRGLSFLFPLMRIQAELSRQIRADPNATVYYKWIRENVDSKLYSDSSFITILVTVIFTYITGETTLKEGIDANAATLDKSLIEREKELLDKFKGVLQKFLLDNIDLHVTAIYALQVFACNKNSPKGLLLRMFMNLYDMEIIYEEAFTRWKEEVNDLHPGKGQALFQVNQWLTWLEQSDEESEEEN